ncbi:amidophosphoribosyltransferase [Egicoccus sp. AB-alg6-2]|uniref:amidophosphoribosyltransferase n=1 Tax=Egicoccus sp. AB-alg6-2 TaxID=3242692 RepID=UPI00359D4A2B
MPAHVDLSAYGEGPREECGVFGIYAPGEDVATLTYFGLYALQHRGQESAGIAVSDGRRIVVHKDMGLVNQVFNETSLAALQGHLAIGHCRYSTTGASSWVNAQPQYQETVRRGGLALGHNGNLVNTAELARELDIPPTNDSEVMAGLLAAGVVAAAASRGDGQTPGLEEAIADLAPRLRGAYSVVVMDQQRLHAFRDPHGVRPLQIGRLQNGGWVVASETAGLDIVGAVYVRDVAPGEIVTIDADGLRSRRFAAPQSNYCLFEWVYLARPDHRQDGGSVLFARRSMGRQLAREAPVEADIVIPVPEAGRDAAAGYATEAGLPFADGLVKNRYVGRTFIQPTQTLRQLGIRLKLSPVREVVEGRRLVVVDDSIVRGNTSRQLVAMLRAAGAREVHLRITSPPIAHPCYYGIDMATRAELIGADLDVDAIRDFVGADSLHYISLEGLIGATPNQRERLCTACFTGEYPIPVPGEHEQLAQIKFDFDASATSVPDDAASLTGDHGVGVVSPAASGGPADAVERQRLADAREGRSVE